MQSIVCISHYKYDKLANHAWISLDMDL